MSDKNKYIYEFTVTRKVNKEVTEDTPAGKLTKNIETKEPVQIVIKAPNRAENEEKSLVYAIEYSNKVRKGMLTNAIVERNYDKDGYISELRNKALSYGNHLLEIQNEYKYLTTKEDKAEEDKTRLKEIEEDWNITQVSLQDLQNNALNMFNYTAESFANQKAKLWLTLNLTYIKDEKSELKPVFKGEDADADEKFKKKLKHFDALSELDDEFYNQIINKSTIYISLWYDGKLNSKEEFDLLEKEFNQEIKEVGDLDTEDSLPAESAEIAPESPVEPAKVEKVKKAAKTVKEDSEPISELALDV